MGQQAMPDRAAVAPKDTFFYWAKDRGGPSAMLHTLQEHYRNLAGAYLQQGMKFEAGLFTDAADEFAELAMAIEEALAARVP